MRVKSEIWVQAFLRQCYGADAPAVVARRGHGDAGAIFIKISLLDGRALLYGPAPAGLTDKVGGRLWTASLGADPVPEDQVDSYLARQAEFDPDFWTVEVEDRMGRHFLGDALIED
jgi:hypothetical protein